MYYDYEETYNPEREKWLDMQYECREYFLDIIEQLYSQESLDVDKFESQLEEMAHILKVTLPVGALQIKRAKVNVPASIQEWEICANNNYLQQVAI